MKENSAIFSVIVFGLILSTLGDQDCSLRKGNKNEKILRRILFANYSKNQRPTTPVHISLHLVVSNLDEVVSESRLELGQNNIN